MDVLVFGANGRTGLAIVDALTLHGHGVVAGVRSDAHLDTLTAAGVRVRRFDLIAESPESIAAKLDGVEAIVFAAGAGQNRPDLAQWLDLDGAVKTIQAARIRRIDRYIMVSAAGAEARATWNIYGIPDFYIAKYYAEEFLRSSGLSYTVVRPAILTSGAARGKVSVRDNGDHHVSRADVAKVIVAALEDSATVGRGFNLYAGSVPIDSLMRETGQGGSAGTR